MPSICQKKDGAACVDFSNTEFYTYEITIKIAIFRPQPRAHTN